MALGHQQQTLHQTTTNNNMSQQHPTYHHQPSNVFLAVKQTQCSLARLSRAHQQPTSTSMSKQQMSSQQTSTNQQSSCQQPKLSAATFVDCLIRRFKDCFAEDLCLQIPVFVVGGLSPGLDGSNLILPPCVSLSGQQISRFSTPKNLKLMNSIRDSCRSIEELDLGANKLTDLIEIYKILQCTPNLRFLNLSGNDLSRSSPVAIASSSAASSSSSVMFSPLMTSSQQQPQSPANDGFRTPLASILQQSLVRRPPHLHLRSCSSLGQQLTQKGRGSLDARRMAAATAALAQSKKTSARSAAAQMSSVVNRSQKSQTKSAATSGPSLRTSNLSLSTNTNQQSSSPINQRTKPTPTAQTSSSSSTTPTSKATKVSRQPTLSTLHLARSVSSLSSSVVDARVCSVGNRQTTSANQRLRCNTNQTPLCTTNNNNSINNFRRTFDSIKALALNDTSCQWRVVCSILSRMPYLEELHLSLNNYQRIELEPANFCHLNLKRLYLCNNPKLKDWRELDKLLAAFPSLESLSMADCAISQIPENLGTSREWRKLLGLNINGWPIKEWPVVERLNELPSLVDLKCKDLDVLSSFKSSFEPRYHLIARLPKLQRLNGSEIEEREHAEKEFLRFFMINSHIERPSRFFELIQVHGFDVALPNVDIDVDLSPPNSAIVKIIYLNRHFYSRQNKDDILMSEDFITKLLDYHSIATKSTTNQQTTSTILSISDNENFGETSTTGKTTNTDKQKTEIHSLTNKDITVSQTTTTTITKQKHTNKQDPATWLFKDDCQEVVSLAVDLRQSVRKFKQNLCSLFSLSQENNTNDMIIYYIDHEMVGLMGPELLKHNQKKLWNYNVQDGDQFIVEHR